ncbi:hypothetical protein, partial [Escherichia coli]|uniref:hypothetical protein n=1 Tax=Escherichia coli TaxID=562 RepID=UPI00200BE597
AAVARHRQADSPLAAVIEPREYPVGGASAATSLSMIAANRPLKNVGEAASARQKQAKKRSLRAVNEHFEPVFNAAMA